MRPTAAPSCASLVDESIAIGVLVAAHVAAGLRMAGPVAVHVCLALVREHLPPANDARLPSGPPGHHRPELVGHVHEDS